MDRRKTSDLQNFDKNYLQKRFWVKNYNFEYICLKHVQITTSNHSFMIFHENDNIFTTEKVRKGTPLRTFL